MDDVISRQEVIKLLDEAWVDGHEYQGWLHDEVNRLPSAQPNLQRNCNELATDCISRQDAMDAVKHAWAKGLEPTQYIEDLPPAQPEPTTEIQEILNYLDTTLHPIVSPDNWNVYAELHDMVSKLPSEQFEVVRCKDCKYYEYDELNDEYCCMEWGYNFPDEYSFCSKAERRTDE